MSKNQKAHEKKEPDDKDKKIDELAKTLQMLQADFENYRKRADKEKQEFKEYARIDTIEKFLPIIDNFELALKHSDNKKEFEEGIKLIFSQMISMLEEIGIRKIDAIGKEFDPQLHEALMADHSDEPKDIIIEEFQTGYMIHSTIGDRIVRPSKVKVSKGKKEAQ